MSSLSIQIAGVRKSFGSRRALNGVTMHFEPGLLHGLIGPDGAGKTTLIRMLMGLLHPDQGAITYFEDGRPVAFPAIRSSITYMPQRQSLYADLSVSEHLDFFRDLYGVPDGLYRTRREELLTLTRMTPFQDRPAGKLSGGMYKKLGLMCSLLHQPRMLLLDEPTNGVDPISRREFWDLLYRLSAGGMTILLSTAYMDEAERCGRVHLMEAGRMIAEGEPRALLEREQAKTFEEVFLKHERLEAETR